MATVSWGFQELLTGPEGFLINAAGTTPGLRPLDTFSSGTQGSGEFMS